MSTNKYFNSFSKYEYGDYSTIKKTKVVLIYTGVSGDSFFNSSKIGWEQTWHYPGFQCLSAALKIHNFEVKLIDFRELIDWSDFRNKLIDINPDVVGFTAVSSTYNRVKQVAKLTKEVLPSAYTIIGGVHVSIIPNEIIKEASFDTVITGEGDISFIELLYVLEKGFTPQKYIVGKIPVLDELPFMDRNLFRTLEDPGLTHIKKPYASVVSSRGCPFNCSFCQPSARIVFGNKVRQRSPSDFIEELVLLKGDGIKSVRIIDDLFILNEKWLIEFITLYKKNKLSFQIICQCRADLICKFKSIFEELKGIGLELVHIGLESGSQKGLDILNKGVTIEENYKAVKICHELGIRVFANYIFGIPGETKEDMEATISMLNETNPEFRAPNILYPTLGSELYNQCKKNHTLLKYDLDSNSNDSNAIESGFIKGIDYKMVEEMYYKSLKTENDNSEEEIFEAFNLITQIKPRNILLVHSVRNYIFNNMINILKKIFAEVTLDIFIQKDELRNFKNYNLGECFLYNGSYFDIDLVDDSIIDKLNLKKYDYIIIPAIKESTIGYKNVEEVALGIKSKFVIKMYSYGVIELVEGGQ